MFEKSQVKHNNLNCHNFFEIFYKHTLIAKTTCSKLDTYQKCFAYSKHSNFENEF